MSAESEMARTIGRCPECGTTGHDQARLDRNPSGWCDACIMASAKRGRRGPAACPWTSALECAMAAERGAAGTSDYIKACPAHQLPEEPVSLDAFLAAASVEAEFLDGPDLAECGCPIDYLQAEGDHQPGCRLARG